MLEASSPDSRGDKPSFRIKKHMKPSKVCPVVLRNKKGVPQILAFEHPHAGFQLVKGTIETGETLGGAALRELAEESGITQAYSDGSLGIWKSDHEDQIWAFERVQVTLRLPDSWEYATLDGGGLVFRFFWQPLEGRLGRGWHPVYHRAIGFIRTTV